MEEYVSVLLVSCDEQNHNVSTQNIFWISFIIIVDSMTVRANKNSYDVKRN